MSVLAAPRFSGFRPSSCSWEWPAWRCCCLSDRARQQDSCLRRPPFQQGPARFGADLDRVLAAAGQRQRIRPASARVRAELISETFDVLSVTVWLLGRGEGAIHRRPRRLRGRASDARRREIDATLRVKCRRAGLRARSSPFDLEDVNEAWAEELRQLNPTTFTERRQSSVCSACGPGNRALAPWCWRIASMGRCTPSEELELLQCIGDQMTSVLLNLRLANEVARARELEAFRTMSAFFVHDLKNAAASLNLMLKNLPVHFDDPAFREDALRGIGNTARRIDEMIGRLTALRQRPDFTRVEADLNQLVSEALDRSTECRTWN